MEEQYGINAADLRHYITSRPLFPPPPIPHPPPDLLSTHRGFNPYDMLLFRSDSTTTTITPPGNTNPEGGRGGSSSSCAAGGCFSGLNVGGGDGGAGRWPRQETLTLLEIRSRLDHKFKEANQKGPLWDEVSRILSEEYGYQRSGKKCREKFENLYKYYKKTKEGKAGRQDGKHYRFFRQLEALYGDSNTSAASASASASEANLVGGNLHYNFPNKNSCLAIHQESTFQGQKLSETSLSLSNYSSDEANTSSSDDGDLNDGMADDDDKNDMKNKKRGQRSWKVKIRDSIDSQMKKLMDKQEAWMEKMMRTMEQKEQERMLREEEWRKQDAARMEKEYKFWANERAWIEARNGALMEALHKLTRKDQLREELIMMASENKNDGGNCETMTNNSVKGGDVWPECEMARLIQLRRGMEVKFQQRGVSEDEEQLWEEIANKMACFGQDRTGVMCKHKWDSINNYLLKYCNKKRKENSKGSATYNYQMRNNNEQVSNQGGEGSGSGVVVGDHIIYSCETSTDHAIRLNHHGNNSSPNTAGNAALSDTSCAFRYFMGDDTNF